MCQCSIYSAIWPLNADPVLRSTRQACVVWLKNRVARAYKLDELIGDTKTVPIPPVDRQAIKQHIIPLLVTASSRPIRVQLTSCVKTVIGSDFPDEWPGLVDQVVSMLQSEDLPTIYAGLLVNLEILKSYKCVLRRIALHDGD